MPDLIWEIEDKSSVFLTFDDGPTVEHTQWILDTLAKYDAKATFFCLGKNVEAHPEIYQRILDEGHSVGNHTYSHQKGWEMDVESYVEYVDKAAEWIESDLFRPPYARIKPSQARALAKRYKLIMWDIISRDYNRQLSPETCLRNVLPYIEGGSIIVFHDSVKAGPNMRYALPRTLEEIARRGLRCARIE